VSSGKALLCHQGEDFFDEILENQVRSTMEATFDISKEIVQQVKKDSSEYVSMASSVDTMNVKLAQATRLLLSVSLLVDQVRGSGTTSSMWCDGQKEDIKAEAFEPQDQGAQLSNNVLSRVLTESLHALAPNRTASTNTGSLETSRAAAFQELCESVELLQSVL
jgi:hypothetical protein